jgi:hypothetical protein
MVLVDEIKIKKARVLKELKNLKWKMVQSNKNGIDFIQNVSKKKISCIQKSMDKKIAYLNKIQNEIKKQKEKIVKINNYVNDRVKLLENKELIKCSICLDNINKNSISLTKCGHLYCYKCLKTALCIDTRCPQCRKTLCESDIILIHYNDTCNYNILDKETSSSLDNDDNIAYIQHLIRRGVRRRDYNHLHTSTRNTRSTRSTRSIEGLHSINETNLRRIRLSHLTEIEMQNNLLRRSIRNYDNDLSLLENNLNTRINMSSMQNLLRDIHLEQLYSVVNTYSVDRRIYLNSVSQRDVIIQTQKNLINSLKNHVNCLNECINIQTSLIDNSAN